MLNRRTLPSVSLDKLKIKHSRNLNSHLQYNVSTKTSHSTHLLHGCDAMTTHHNKYKYVVQLIRSTTGVSRLVTQDGVRGLGGHRRGLRLSRRRGTLLLCKRGGGPLKCDHTHNNTSPHLSFLSSLPCDSTAIG